VGVAGSDAASDAQVRGGHDGPEPMDASTGQGGVGGAQDSGPSSDSAVAGSGGTGASGSGGAGASGSGGSSGACGQPPNVPLEGFWKEIAQIPCAGAEMAPADTIEELHFTVTSISLDKQLTGEFSVTWSPIEDYVDYSGTFVAHGAQNGSLSLTVGSTNNYEPEDIDAQGSFEHCNDQLVLRNVWLGTARNQSPSPIPMCGQRFKKQLR
jgi:hypothetical protein